MKGGNKTNHPHLREIFFYERSTIKQNTGFKIIWLSNILPLSVRGEGYSRSSLCSLNLRYKVKKF